MKEWPGEALAAEPLTRRSALVALAHDPKVDDPGLAAALASQAFYVGALGSRRTHGRRLARLKMLGFSDAELARIRGPVGLAIGARSPSEIAIAILAEMIQVRRAPKPARIGGVVLAAGLSRRMGHNKLVAEVNGKSLVRHAAEAALEAGLDPVTVVTGHQQLEIEKALAGLPVRFVHNPSFADGLSTSLKKGIESLPEDCAAAMVLLGDMPGVTPDLARRVAAAFEPAKGQAQHLCGGRRWRTRPSGVVGKAILSRIDAAFRRSGRARPDGGACGEYRRGGGGRCWSPHRPRYPGGAGELPGPDHALKTRFSRSRLTARNL